MMIASKVKLIVIMLPMSTKTIDISVLACAFIHVRFHVFTNYYSDYKLIFEKLLKSNIEI